MSDLKQIVGPVYEAETKHSYQGPEPHQEDLSSEVGPVYRVERRHSFQKGWSKEMDKKTVKVKFLLSLSTCTPRVLCMQWSTSTSTSRASPARSARPPPPPGPSGEPTDRPGTTTNTPSL